MLIKLVGFCLICYLINGTITHKFSVGKYNIKVDNQTCAY
jgi:hypothetical protein